MYVELNPTAGRQALFSFYFPRGFLFVGSNPISASYIKHSSPLSILNRLLAWSISRRWPKYSPPHDAASPGARYCPIPQRVIRTKAMEKDLLDGHRKASLAFSGLLDSSIHRSYPSVSSHSFPPRRFDPQAGECRPRYAIFFFVPIIFRWTVLFPSKGTRSSVDFIPFLFRIFIVRTVKVVDFLFAGLSHSVVPSWTFYSLKELELSIFWILRVSSCVDFRAFRTFPYLDMSEWKFK